MNAASLAGKRVLLVVARFFGYEKAIAAELERRGASVDTLPDRPFDTPVMKAVTRFSLRMVLPAANRYYIDALGKLGRGHYDLIFVVNGQTVSKKTLQWLKQQYPTSRYVLYMWDSFNNRSAVRQNLPLFDRSLTFDPDCAKAYGLVFRPLFYSPGFDPAPPESFDYHVSFIGTIHTDRYAILSAFDRGLPQTIRRFWYLYLHAPWVYHVQRTFNPRFAGARKEQFSFEPLAKANVHSIFQRSRAILDIEHPRQTGLTIRTLETIGASRKLITTNARVREYDFFDPVNIQVVDRGAPRADPAFLEAPYKPLPPALYYKYSIAGWMDDVLS